MRVFSILAILLVAACGGDSPPPSVVLHGQSDGFGSRGVHVVQRGDTLSSISERYEMRFNDVAYMNDLRAPYALAVGQRLKLPPPKEYRVRGGDTLYLISYMFDVEVEGIARLNSISDPLRLRIGRVLELPSVASPSRERFDVQPSDKPVRQAEGAVKPSSKPRERVSKVEVKTPKRSSSKFMRPVRGRILSGYGPKANGLHNDGINIAAARGTPVGAAENGVVVYAGNGLKGSGNLVLVRHEDRWMSAYAHLDRIDVSNGQVLKRGQKLGTVGSTGAVREPQLHFEIRRGTKALNPTPYLQ